MISHSEGNNAMPKLCTFIQFCYMYMGNGMTQDNFTAYLFNSNFAGKNPLHPLKVQAL